MIATAMLAAMVLGLGGAAPAAPYTWDGTTGTWSAGGSGWVEGAYPANGAATDTEAIFDATGAAQLSPAVSGTVEANKLTFGLTGYSIGSGTISLNGASPTITAGSTLSATIDSSIDGTAGLIKDGEGTLSLSALNTSGGNIQVNNGTLEMTGGTVSGGNFTGGVNSTCAVKMTGGSITLSGMASVGGAGTVGNPSSMVMSGSSSFTTAGNFSVGGMAGGVTGSGEFAMKDSATLTVQNTANYGFYVQGDGASGTAHMLIQDSAVLNVDNRLTVSSNFGTLTQTGGEVNCTNPAGAGGQWIRIANGPGRWGWYNMTGGSWNINANPGGAAYIVSVGTNWGLGYINLSGTGAINIPDDSYLTLTGNQAGSQGYFGEVNLAGGTLTTPQVKTNDRGNLGGVFNFNGGTLKAARSESAFMQDLEKSGATWNGCNVYAAGAVIDTNGFNITIAQPLAEPAGNGVTSVSLTPGPETYVAPPRVTFSQAIPGDNGYVTMAQGFATLDASGHVNGIVLTNPGSGYTAAATVSFDSGTSTATAAIGSVGGGGLTKLGNGTLTLSGVNTYTGATTVSAGTLLINGSHTVGGAYTVANTAAVGGKGTIGGAVVVQSGGKLVPGDSSVETLHIVPGTLSGSVTMAANSVYEWEFDGTAGDKVEITGSLLLDAGWKVALVNAGGMPAFGSEYDMFTYTPGSFSGTVAGIIESSPAGWPFARIFQDDADGLIYLAFSRLGDANNDGVVDAADYITVKKNFGRTGGATWEQGNFNGDSNVDYADLQILMANFGAGALTPATTPEPCSAVLLMFGAAAMLRRRAGIGRAGR